MPPQLGLTSRETLICESYAPNIHRCSLMDTRFSRRTMPPRDPAHLAFIFKELGCPSSGYAVASQTPARRISVIIKTSYQSTFVQDLSRLFVLASLGAPLENTFPRNFLWNLSIQ